MKKLIVCLFTLILATPALFAQNRVQEQAKLSPLTQLYLFKAKKQAPGQVVLPGYVYKKGADNKLYMSALIKVNGSVQEGSLSAMGVHIGTKAGNIWTAQVPVEKVELFTAMSGIDYIQLDEPIVPAMDSVRRVTRVDSVHAGYNLPMPYNGDNVIVGIIDFGFDYTQPVFFDTLGNKYRVKKVWEQKKSSGTPPAGFIYGNEMTDSIAMWAEETDNKEQFHGTHVTGIAAGSGVGSTGNKKFRGIAYKADIVLVGILPDSDQWVNTGAADVIDAINYIYTYSTAQGKPAVINLSWGSLLGPLDGTSLFSIALDNLTGPGKIFVCSAGNNGDEDLHLQKTFTATDTTVQTFMRIKNTPIGKVTWVDIWGNTGKDFCIKATMFKATQEGNSTGFICLGNGIQTAWALESNGDTCFITTTSATADFNGEPRMFIEIYSKGTDYLRLTVKGTDGVVNLWNSYAYRAEGYWTPFEKLGFASAAGGDIAYTISDISASYSAVCAGADASKVSWKDLNNNTNTYQGFATWGDIARFSSRGPTADGRVKPDITAPGLTVASAVSSFDTAFLAQQPLYGYVVSKYFNPVNSRTYPFAVFNGTSMSSPCVTGIVALMLQIKPDLTPSQVQSILAETAIHDSHTGNLSWEGDNTWGHGKVNAYGAVRRTLQLSLGVSEFKNGTLDCILYPNPNGGIFTLDYTGNKAGVIKMEVCDAIGKLVLSENWNTIAGNNTRQINISSFTKGIYFIKLTGKEGYSALKVLKY